MVTLSVVTCDEKLSVADGYVIDSCVTFVRNLVMVSVVRFDEKLSGDEGDVTFF